MKTIKLDPAFNVDCDTSATYHVSDETGVIGYVKFDFGSCAHKVEIHLPTLIYFAQTACADEAAQMLDTFFDDSDAPVTEFSIDL